LNWTIRDSPLFMFPFQSVDFRCGIIWLTGLAISLSTIDTRRLLRWKSMSIITPWLPPSLSLYFHLVLFISLFNLSSSSLRYKFYFYIICMAYIWFIIACCIICKCNLLSSNLDRDLIICIDNFQGIFFYPFNVK